MHSYLYAEQCDMVLCSKIFVNVSTHHNEYNSLVVDLTCSEPLPLDKDESMRPWGVTAAVAYLTSSILPLTCTSESTRLVLSKNISYIFLSKVDSWDYGTYHSYPLLYLEQVNETVVASGSHPLKSSLLYVDQDAHCSSDQNIWVKVCMCEDPGTVEEFCQNISDVKFKKELSLTEYHIFGELRSEYYETYYYYIPMKSSTSPDYYDFWCSEPVVETSGLLFPEMSFSHYDSVELSIGTKRTPQSVTTLPEFDSHCPSHHKKLQFYLSYNVVKVYFYHFNYVQRMFIPQQVQYFPIDLVRWNTALKSRECIVVRLSAFSKYCICASTNKSESFCHSTPDNIFLNLALWNTVSGKRQNKSDEPEGNATSKKIDDPDNFNLFHPTAQLPANKETKADDDDAWRWQVANLNGKSSKFRFHERAERIRQKLEFALDDPFTTELKMLDSKHQSIVGKDAGGEISITATTTSQIPIFVANISIGTPPQTFSVEVDYFWGGELSLFGCSVNTSRWDTKRAIYPPWHTYNIGASTSYSPLPGNFSDDYAVFDEDNDEVHFYHLRGHTGSDVIHLDGLNLSNVPMGIIDSAPLHNDVFYFPTDATLGLADVDPDIDTHLNYSFVKLISPQLDKPVVCLWSNRSLTDDHCGEALITIGAEDIENCETDWVYVPTLEKHHFFTYATNASAVAANGTILATAEINQTVSGVIIITDLVTWLMVPRSVYELMVNASGAIWDSNYVGRHIVCNYAACEDCADDKLSQLGSVYVSVDNTTENQTVIRPADYIGNYFSPSYQRNICVIFVAVWNESRGYQPIVLGAKYLNNRCISRNINTGEIGFATAKNKNLDMNQSTTNKQTMGTNSGTIQSSGASTAIPNTTKRPPGSTTVSDDSDYDYD